MPITPFHFGPGLLFKAYAPARVSWLAFALANILIDLEPIIYFLFTGDPAHRHLHSYIGATAVAAVSVFPGRLLAECWLRWWNRHLNPAQARWLGTSTRVPLSAAIAGAVLGSFSHILLDSFMHADMLPSWPWAAGNGLLYQVSVDHLHLLCAGAGLWGALRLGLRGWLSLPDSALGRTLRSAGRLIDQTALASVLFLGIILAVALYQSTPVMDRAAFDATVWRQTPAKMFYGNPRVPMASAALRQLDAQRPSRSDAIALLGPPDAGDRPAQVSYHLGFLHWLSMDPDTLDIEYSADGRFVEARIVRH
jgi:hypothetical protein